MKNFTIENETNNITVHESVKEAEAVPDSERFGTEAAPAKLAANWPLGRLVEIWNSLPGATEVKKFKDRATAVSRIWKAIQTLGQTEPVVADEPAQELAAATEIAQPEAAIPQTQAPAPDSDVAPQTPDVAPQTPDVAPEDAPAKTKAPRVKKEPKPAREARPAR